MLRQIELFKVFTLTSSLWYLTRSTQPTYAKESKHTKIDVDDEKHELILGKYFLEKITIFLRNCILQTKIIFKDRVVITA